MTATDDEEDDRSFREFGRVSGTVSSFTAAAFGVLIGLGVFGLPRLELTALPVFRSYTIPPSSIVRTGQNLCWTRSGEKVRNPPLIDVDITVDYISDKTGKLGHQPTPALFVESTGDDFTTDDVRGVGLFSTRVCVRLASVIRPDQPVQVRQTAYFGSVTTLWTVPYTLPTIVFPSSAASLFVKHDTGGAPGDNAVAGPRSSVLEKRSDADMLDDVRQDMAVMQRVPSKPVTLDDMLRDEDDGPAGIVHMDTTLTPRDAARVKQSGIQHGDPSRRATLRRLIPEGLDQEDRDTLGPYDSGGR